MEGETSDGKQWLEYRVKGNICGNCIVIVRVALLSWFLTLNAPKVAIIDIVYFPPPLNHLLNLVSAKYAIKQRTERHLE